jgi:hypothetical protein
VHRSPRSVTAQDAPSNPRPGSGPIMTIGSNPGGGILTAGGPVNATPEAAFPPSASTSRGLVTPSRLRPA